MPFDQTKLGVTYHGRVSMTTLTNATTPTGDDLDLTIETQKKIRFLPGQDPGAIAGQDNVIDLGGIVDLGLDGATAKIRVSNTGVVPTIGTADQSEFILGELGEIVRVGGTVTQTGPGPDTANEDFRIELQPYSLDSANSFDVTLTDVSSSAARAAADILVSCSVGPLNVTSATGNVNLGTAGSGQVQVVSDLEVAGALTIGGQAVTPGGGGGGGGGDDNTQTTAPVDLRPWATDSFRDLRVTVADVSTAGTRAASDLRLTTSADGLVVDSASGSVAVGGVALGTTTVRNAAQVNGLATLSGGLTVDAAGATDLQGTVVVGGVATLSGGLTVDAAGATDLQGTVGVGGLATLSGGLTVDAAGATDLQGTVGVGGLATLSGGLTVDAAGATDLQGTVGVAGLATLSGGLTVDAAGATDLQGTVGVAGLATLSGGLTVDAAGATDLQGTVGVAGLATLSGGLTVDAAGATDLQGTVGVAGLATLSGGLTVDAAGATDLQGTVTLSGVPTFDTAGAPFQPQPTPVASGGTEEDVLVVQSGAYALQSEFPRVKLALQGADPAVPGAAGSANLWLDSNEDLRTNLVREGSGATANLTPLRSLGDLVVHDGTSETRLPIGEPNQVLFATSDLENNPLGVAWNFLTKDAEETPDGAPRYLYAVSGIEPALTATYTPVVFDDQRKVDPEAFLVSANSIITVRVAATYLLTARVSVRTAASSSVDNEWGCRVMLDTGGGFAVVPGTDLGQSFLDRRDEQSSAIWQSFAIALSEGDRIQVEAAQVSGTSGLLLSGGLCSITLNRFTFDLIDDATTYASIYTTSTQAAPSGSQALVSFTDARVLDTANYTFSAPSGTVTLARAGVYGAALSAGTTCTADNVLSRLRVLLNGTPVAGGEVWICNEASARPSGADGAFVLFTAAAADTVSVDFEQTVGGGSIDLTSASLTLFHFNSTINGQANIGSYGAGASADLTVTTLYQDINLDTTADPAGGGVFVQHTDGTPVFTLQERGLYYVSVSAALLNTNTTGSTGRITSARTRLSLDIGSGFSEILGLDSYHDSRASGTDTTAGSGVFELPQNAGLKLESVQTSGTGGTQLVASGTSVSVTRLEDINIETDVLLKFGSFYKSARSPTLVTTTSTNFTEKLRVITDYLPAGTYRVGVVFRVGAAGSSKRVEVRVQADDTETVFLNYLYNTESLSVEAVSGFGSTYLGEGFHTIDLDFRTATNGREVGIQDCVIEFWRVT